MYVLGQTNLDRLEVYYDDEGGPCSKEGAAGCLVFYLRQLRGADRHIFADSSNNIETERAGVVRLVEKIEGLAGDDGQPIETMTDEVFDQLDNWIINRISLRIVEKMEATQEQLGESETPSGS